MTTESVRESSAFIMQAIRAAKAEAQHAGKCDGRCRTCPPDQLHACMARRHALHGEAEAPLAGRARDE